MEARLLPAIVPEAVRSSSTTAKAWLKLRAGKDASVELTAAATRKSESPRCVESPAARCVCCGGRVKAMPVASDELCDGS